MNSFTSPLFKIQYRKSGTTTYVSVVSQRGALQTTSSEKVLPLIVEYDENGLVALHDAQSVMKGFHPHPYKPNSKEFNEERLADVEVANLNKFLEHYPTLNEFVQNGRRVKHPIAQLVYDTMVYLKPTADYERTLKQLNFLDRGREQAGALELVNVHLQERHGFQLDLHAVPKRKVGTRAYIASKAGYGLAPGMLSFGLHRAIPTDRIAREVSSIKSCEKFAHPAPCPINVPEVIQPFVSWVRVGVIFPQHSMLDSADISPSAVPKLACVLEKKIEVRDLSAVPEEERNIKPKNYRAGIELVHEEIQVTDETEMGLPCVKLVFPGGVKVVGQTVEEQYQAKDAKGADIDILMDFETFAAKGAVAVLAALIDPRMWDCKPQYEDCKKVVEERMLQPWDEVHVGETQYQGMVGYLPVFRTRHRHTELNKGTNRVGSDIISHSILQEKFTVRPDVEKEYSELTEFRSQLTMMMERLACTL